MSFDVDRFIADCRAASTQGEVLELVHCAVERRSEVLDAIGRIEEQATLTLFRSSTLTVQVLSWAPGMRAPAHEHKMWAVLGVCAGRENNGFYRRAGDRIERDGGISLADGEVHALPDDVIHDVVNPLDAFTVALHVYGGDIIDAPRSAWHPFTGQEVAFDQARVDRLVEAFNARQRGEPVPFAAASVQRIMSEIVREQGF